MVLRCVVGLGLAFQLYMPNLQAIEFTQKDTSCVAWEAKKTMFLFRKVQPVGRNCAAKVRFAEGVSDGSYRIEVEVPIAAFDSGEPDRDKDVAVLLKSEEDPNLLVYTSDLPLERWRSLMVDSGKVDGYLRIGKSDHPIEIPIKIDNEIIQGSVETSFSALSLQAPEVALGVVASVEDALTLHFNLPLSSVEGWQQINKTESLPDESPE